jgi:hypothetical protein
MGNAVTSQAESDEEILTFDIPDEALERAASAEQQATTLNGKTVNSSALVMSNEGLVGGAKSVSAPNQS